MYYHWEDVKLKEYIPHLYFSLQSLGYIDRKDNIAVGAYADYI